MTTIVSLNFTCVSVRDFFTGWLKNGKVNYAHVFNVAKEEGRRGRVKCMGQKVECKLYNIDKFITPVLRVTPT